MSKKDKLLTASALILMMIIISIILLPNRDHKIIERNDAFFIKNKTDKPYIFIYEKNGDETNTSKTELILPGDVDEIWKWKGTEYEIKKIKVAGKYGIKELK